MDEPIKAAYLQDDNGNHSMLRMMSLVCLIIAIVIGFILIAKSPEMKDPFVGIYVFTAFLIAAFAPKVIQKFAEIMPAMLNKR